ncbi:TetR/AcrR family transcriptional regulator [Lentzea sp. NEAU-D7]|uniref:TetR/AcrR family transcriptional regulator n=1 Tax=Lentzea sp. NEAU-D7 TaxID=2994667 RepID=UPI00224B250E|nr:TetR/AcrR family transcriptional regulator [Lentzea sp. NEAU-D7]MCX2947717.1 TetR/AcrR family transcriptional regulator [Lentzea sp. NEAU-D7]
MPSARETELLEAAYRYVLTHGLADVSLRPLAAAIGSSTRVLLYLFGSKEGLVKALLARARADELALLGDIGTGPGVVARLWEWLSAPAHRPLLTLWLEAYARSLVEPDGPWAGFARATVEDWLEVLRAAQPRDVRDTDAGLAARTRELALLRGALLDLLATGEAERVLSAVRG